MQWVKIGTVSILNPEDMTVQVVFDGLDTSVSDELSIVIPPSRAQEYHMPDVGDTVLCVFTESQGFCIGMIQDATPEMTAGEWGILFDDENQVMYKDGILSVKAKEVIFEGTKVTITAPEVIVTGDFKVSGTINGLTPGSGSL
ncbi:hypothetical protein J23TS9_06050 [Paenibacillus sp. J23TS9]|uniref:hypothetical protein n=1 Tax=Paenibacillus sp. J23TS9 TaxID=2807193 RepID=UPI001B2900C5|nr:hypothetical protein [Paenibacillus sp. J23TS9]GIP25475.1 hypothetical protein J23TS9_06050 [Paenibacillus sp. J23TS9]